jgi:PIN domain nuclease of toxin-antitoxin system
MLPPLLDTHIFIWWRSDPGRLSEAKSEVLRNLEKRGQAAALSAVSLRELASAGQRGRLTSEVPWELWLDEIETNPSFSIMPLTARIAAESVQLGDDFPKDPFDQIIVATARCHGLRLMTADERIRRWGKVSVI